MNKLHLAVLLVALWAVGSAVGDQSTQAAGFEATTGKEAVWQNYTYVPNTLYVSLELRNSTFTKSAHACAEICNIDPMCTDWSWCPPEANNSCEVFTFSNIFTKEANLTSGTCLTSADPAEGRKAFLDVNGPAVPWVAGYWIPPAASLTGGQSNQGNSSATTGSSNSTASNTSNSPAPSGCGNIKANTFVDASVGFIAGTPLTDNVAECCQACADTKGCTDFMYCAANATSCTNWVTNGTGYTFFLSSAKPKMCLLLAVPNGKKTSVYAQGPGTPWSSGTLSN